MHVTFDPLNPIEAAVVAAMLSPVTGETAHPVVAVNNAGDCASGRTPAEASATGGEGGQVTASALAVEPKKRARRSKDQTEAAPVEAAAAAEPYADETQGEMVWEEAPAAEPVTFTVDDVRAAVSRCTANHGMAHALTILNKFGASRISELKAEDYASVVKACDVG